MADTFYDSELTGEQIDKALKAVDGLIVPSNNGKIVSVENGKLVAKSARDFSDDAVLEHLTVNANGDYYPGTGVDGFDEVHVAVPNSYTAADEGKVVSSGALVAQTSRSSPITENGTYDTTENNAVTVNVPSGGATIQPLNVTQNGTYTPSSGVDGYSPVVVNVSGGGGGDIPLLTRAAWQSLTEAQKQSYGLVAIQDKVSGFKRGELVNGAEYIPSWMIYSSGDILAEASFEDIFDASEWGNNILVDGATRFGNGAVITNSLKSSTSIPLSAMLDTVDKSFSAYIVGKRIATNDGNRLIMSFGDENSSTANGLGLLVNTSSDVTLSLWGNDTQFSQSANQWKLDDMICVALVYNYDTKLAWGYVLRSTKDSVDKLSKARPTRKSSRVVVGKTFPTTSTPTNDNRTNFAVAYMGVVNSADSEATVLANMVNIANNLEALA